MKEITAEIKIEVPVVPRFVADYIEWFERDHIPLINNEIIIIDNLLSVPPAFGDDEEKLENWVNQNAFLLIEAYQHGYTVE